MLQKLEELSRSHKELTQRLADPAVLADQAEYRKANKALSTIAPVVELYQRYRRLREEREQAATMLVDLPKEDELYALALDERRDLDRRLEALELELQTELAPKDPNDARNVVLEIRAGAGGDEASLFAAELFRMYSRYADERGWKVNIIDISESEVGGFKEIEAIIEGRGAFSRLKFEGGVHRVQRVPQTEASGRIHTSAVTVAVLPEAEDVEIDVDEGDLRVDRFCASGPGGQGVNTTYSAVRLTHLPTGLVVSCQDERSQIKNKAKALRVLKSRLLEIEREKQQSEVSAERRRMVGSGDRSEKIRTYNFKENRVTDHRIGLTIHRLPDVLGGHLDVLVDPLVSHFRAQQMQESAARTVST
jgi:peptide chain release factor 1